MSITSSNTTIPCDHAVRVTRKATEDGDMCVLCGKIVRPVSYIEPAGNASYPKPYTTKAKEGA